MTNIFDYVKKYGRFTFKEKEFNDLDNLVFSSLAYLNFSKDIVNNNSLEEVAKIYLENNKYKEVAKLGIAQKEAYLLLEEIIKQPRYKYITLSNYEYSNNKDMQFSALKFRISKKLIYISFEGTDELISGWKEDVQLACFFPVPSQKEAIKYAKRNIKLFGPKVIIGGHSKGGNLALVSAMYLNIFKYLKLKKVYSNDGPGLRKKEFKSLKYKRVRKKLVHIVPNYSMIGILLRNDKYKVIKSSKKNILCHAISNWEVKDDRLVESELSKKSKNLEQRLIHWLETHTDIEKIKLTNTIFRILEDCNIKTVMELTKIKNIINVMKEIKNIDEETKTLAIDLINYSLQTKKSVNK